MGRGRRDDDDDIEDEDDDDGAASADRYGRHFPEWRFLLSTGHSLLLHGYGSKRSLLNRFGRDELSREGDVVHVDGYDRTVTIDGILDALARRLLPSPGEGAAAEPSGQGAPVPADAVGGGGGGEGGVGGGGAVATTTVGGPSPPARRAADLARAVSSSSARSRPVFLVLHNIDGPGLCTSAAQEALAALTARSAPSVGGGGTRAVRLAASVDRVDAAATLWDRGTSSEFAWVWKEVHTRSPYYEEVRLGSARPKRTVRFGRARSTEEGILRVLTSIAPRHTECLQMLARLQRERAPGSSSSSSSSSTAVPYTVWKERCVGEMIVNADASLRSVLTELADHGAVEYGRDGGSRAEMVRIPYPETVLGQILNFRRQQ